METFFQIPRQTGTFQNLVALSSFITRFEVCSFETMQPVKGAQWEMSSKQTNVMFAFSITKTHCVYPTGCTRSSSSLTLLTHCCIVGVLLPPLDQWSSVVSPACTCMHKISQIGTHSQKNCSKALLEKWNSTRNL